MMLEDSKNDYRELIATILRKRHIEYFGIAFLRFMMTWAETE